MSISYGYDAGGNIISVETPYVTRMIVEFYKGFPIVVDEAGNYYAYAPDLSYATSAQSTIEAVKQQIDNLTAPAPTPTPEPIPTTSISPAPTLTPTPTPTPSKTALGLFLVGALGLGVIVYAVSKR